MHLFFPLVSDIDEAQRVRVRVRHTSEQGGNDGAASSAVLGRNTLTPVDRLVMMMMIWAFRRMGRIYSTSKKKKRQLEKSKCTEKKRTSTDDW